MQCIAVLLIQSAFPPDKANPTRACPPAFLSAGGAGIRLHHSLPCSPPLPSLRLRHFRGPSASVRQWLRGVGAAHHTSCSLPRSPNGLSLTPSLPPSRSLCREVATCRTVVPHYPCSFSRRSSVGASRCQSNQGFLAFKFTFHNAVTHRCR